MASRDGAASNAASSNDDTFPRFPGRAEFSVPPSVISSRMTDIAIENGDDLEAQRGVGEAKRSRTAAEVQSRPGTAITGMSSRALWSPAVPLRRGLSAHRRSVNGSVSSTTMSVTRPPSAASRSHVPSLSSHAFFRPMSSQKLQAQRGASRPSTMARQVAMRGESTLTHSETDTARHSLVSNTGRINDEYDTQPPPSRGTEVTEQGTYDRATANTSPTHKRYTAGSVAESLRPLQRKQEETRKLDVDVNKEFQPNPNQSTPIRTPRSFRSSFLLPTRNDTAQTSSKRAMQGGEKLDSAESTPRIASANMQRNLDSDTAEKTKAKSGRNFEYFEGNTVFCMGGRLQNTRDRPVNIATGSLIVVPAVLFFIFSAPWIWDNISPAIPITFAYVFYICMSSFVHASGSNPGILPRNLHRFPPPEENEDLLRLGPPTNDWTLVRSVEKSAAAMEVPVKYCKTCNLWRPPRTHHCRLCDNCIETQDHHCVWLNNCVGRRNYRYFFTFVSSATLLAVYLVGASLAQLLVYSDQQGVTFSDAIIYFRVPFAMVIYGFLISLYPTALMGYHIFLMARGETTREYLNSQKFVKSERYRPFTQGSGLRNILVVLCRPRPPTYHLFKEGYLAGDQRYATGRVVRRGPSKEGVELQAVTTHHSQRPSAGSQGTIAVGMSGAA